MTIAREHTQMLQAIGDWEEETAAAQREVLLGKDPILVRFFAKTTHLNHWHDETGIVWGTYSEGCGLCRDGVC